MARRKLLNASYVSAPTSSADPQFTDADGSMPLLRALFANNWDGYADPWSRENARRHATSLGNQNIIRVLLRHGAAVDARHNTGRKTTLMFAAMLSGFVSLGAVRELLRGGEVANHLASAYG